MTEAGLIAVFLFGALALCVLLTRLVLVELERRSILDRPNRRSSHRRPTPRGGGIAVVSVIAIAWTIVAVISGAGIAQTVMLVAALGLAVVFWFDDLGELPISYRLAAQAIAVISVLAVSPQLAAPFDITGLGAVAFGLAALTWLWFINLYNFMDGIDGISGVQTALIGLGVVALATGDAVAGSDGLRGAAVAGAGLGFLVWNWPRARIFLGDVGSIPLGFLTGWLLLNAAAQGAWAAALILPAYYLCDATVTLFWRTASGKRPWEAHRDHFYQRAIGSDGRHEPVLIRIIGLSLLLLALAVAAIDRPLLSLAAAGIGTAALLVNFALAPDRPG